MDHVAMLKKYLHDRGQRDLLCVGNPFVTISRQAGAGGHTLAREILRALEARMPDDVGQGWEVFDHKLCLLLAQDPQFNVSFNALLAEEYRSEISQFVLDMLSGQSRQYALYKRIFEIVRALATIGKVVIVGRAGNCITADMPMGVRLRIVACEETRIRNMVQLLEVSPDEARKTLKKQDAERARLLNDFFCKDINDPHLYDAILNADSMNPTEMADIVVSLIVQRLSRYGMAIR